MVDKAMNISHLLTQESKESFSASRSNGGGFPYGLNALGWVGAATAFAAPTAGFADPAFVIPVILWFASTCLARMSPSGFGLTELAMVLFVCCPPCARLE